MAEHVMDTSVLQALLASAWSDGYDKGVATYGGGGDDNPYWAPAPAVSEEDLEKINSLLAGNSEDL